MTEPDMELYDIRVVVDRIEGRSVCGMRVGDEFTVTDSSQVRIPEGQHFCLYAMHACIPLIPAKQRRLPGADWLERDSEVACPDPEERLIMRIKRTGTTRLASDDLT